MKAEEFIKDNMQSIMTSPYKSEEVVFIEVVRKAIEMVRNEKPEHISTVQDCELAVRVTKEKAVEAFISVFKEILGACYQSDVDKFKEKLEEKA